MRKLEAVFAVLIATMAISFAWMFGEAKPSGVELLLGQNFSLLKLIYSIYLFFFSIFPPFDPSFCLSAFKHGQIGFSL